jgi:hypothetical protein
MSQGPRWLAGPPWSSDHGRPWVHRSCAVWLLRSTGACCDEGKKGEGSNAVHTNGFSDRGSGRVELAAVDNGGGGSYFDGEAKGKWRGGTRVGGGCGVKKVL